MPNAIGQLQHALSTMAYSLLMLLAAAASLQAQDQPALPITKSLPTTTAPTNNATAQLTVQLTEPLTEKLTRQQILELREIADLKARMGDGVSERLKGVVSGSDPEQQFHDSLRKLAAKKKTTPLTLLPTAAKKPPKRNTIATTGSAQSVLRATAKKLEDLAAELEQARFYDKADDLRETAAKYWLQARSLD